MRDLHLQEIEDAAARSGVGAFKTRMEIVVLSLLDDDREIALGQIDVARVASLESMERVASPFRSAAESAKASRVAHGLLAHSFGRLRAMIEAPDDDAPTERPS